LLILAVALATPTISYQLWASAQSRELAMKQAKVRVNELTRLAVTEENDSLQDAANLLRVLKHVPSVATAAPEECHELLSEITNEHPRIDQVAVMRGDGSIACTSAQAVPPTFKVSDREWFKEAIAIDAPSTVVSKLLISRARGLPGVIVATGNNPDQNGSRSAIGALMNLSWFNEIAANLSNSAGASIQIIDGRDGVVIAQSAILGRVVPGQALSPDLAEKIRTTAQGTTEIETPGRGTEIVGYRWLPGETNSHSTVLVSLNKSTVVAEADRHLILGLLTDMAALTCGVLIAWAVAELSIIRPLSSLARMAVSFGGGNLEARVAVDEFSVAELKILGDTLNRAVEQVQLRDHELEKLTLRDPLTGLANRRCFDSALDHAWKRATRNGTSVALIMVDVDHFKLFNDTYGHLAGDECLRNIAAAISKRARSADDIVSRYGGEEIAILIPGIDLYDAATMADRVVIEVRNLELPHKAAPSHWVSVSAGLAIMAPIVGGADPHTLIEAADQALYDAKRSGRNRAVCVGLETTAGS
jgi:diguanylate cyclase (GGDEF)-like protein